MNKELILFTQRVKVFKPQKNKQLVDFIVPQSTSKALLYPDMENLTREEAWNVNTHEAHILSLYVLCTGYYSLVM